MGSIADGGEERREVLRIARVHGKKRIRQRVVPRGP
jgi:hypothetical protein